MELIFQKKFEFKKNTAWKLPDTKEFYSRENEKYQPLQVIRSILNFVKHKLDDYKIEEWSDHTRKRNPAQLIMYHLKNEIKCEFVTQAFAKMYEFNCSYPIIQPVEKLFSVHLCEAPGAFITSINHYLKLNHPDTLRFQYLATTLNPYYEGNSLANTILDDRLILHTLPNWFFGESYNGDILDEGNIRSLIERCKSLCEIEGGGPQLVTGDGSIDCLDNPEFQEEFVSNLHTSEFITSLALLANGGSLILKFFTFYETTTVSMLYVLNCCFKSVNVFKPASSKEGNSEVYIIAIGYEKSLISDELVDRLLSNFKSSQNSMLPLEIIPQDFLAQVQSAAKFFMNLQVSVIEGNIKWFRKFDKYENHRLKLLKKATVDYYIKKYDMRPIKENQKLLHNVQFFTDINLNVRVHSGSHAERISFHKLSKADQLQVLYDRLKYFHDLTASQRSFKDTITLSIDQNPRDFLKLIRGKPILKVMSSKFILVTIMKYFMELRKFMEDATSIVITPFKNKTYIIESGAFTADINFLQNIKSYDVYEKTVINLILTEMLNQKSEEFVIKDLLFLTQFLVGVLIYLGSFVYNEIHFEIPQIKFASLRSGWVENVNFLMQSLESEDSIIGICDTKLLFTCNADLYRSIIHFNNLLCLKYCSTFLNCIN